MSKNVDFWKKTQKALEYLLDYYKDPDNEKKYTDKEMLDNLLILSRVYGAIQEKEKQAKFNKGIEHCE